jgi:hypothetical protein
MSAMRFRRPWPFPPVTRVVAEQAGGNDVVSVVRTTLGTRMEMLGSASEDFRQSTRLAIYRQTVAKGFIPYGQAAVEAAPPLCGHFLTTQILQCFHCTGTPFNFMRSECATSQVDAPWQEAIARARPEISWFHMPKRET